MTLADWKSIRLGTVCTKVGSGATPRGGSDVYLSSGPYALIRSQNVYNDGFHHDGLAYIGEQHAAELANVEVLEGDVLLNITGDSVARACQVDPHVLPARVNQHVAIIRPNPQKLDPRFLRYFFVSPEMQTKLLSWAGSGGTRNALTKGMIESFDVPAPEDINEQRAIAHILGTLDDKIELNRRISETLEAMARALFKSWFVDFDPVHAKAARLPAGRTAASTPPWPKRGTWCVYALECEGGSVYIGHTAHLERRFEEHSKGKGADWTKRYPPKRVAYWEEAPTQAAAIEREKNLKSGSGREGLKLEIAERDEESGTLPQPPCLPVRQVADLFPARLVDSELGEIPEGWEVGTLADLSIVNPEVWTKETRPAELNYVDLSNTKWGRIEVVASYQAADAPSRAQRVLRPADTIIGTVRPGNGSYALISEHGLTGSTGFAVLRPQTAEYAAFIYLAATAADNIDTLAHLADGAAYPAVRPEVVAATPIVRPNPEVFDRFSWAAGPLLAKIAQNERESRTLAALRDTLLPRLISGELRVENVDRIPTDKRRLPC